MIRKFLCALLCALLLAGCGTPALPGEGMTFTDDTGAEVTAPYEPRKVAVLTSSLADLWLTAGGAVHITVGETRDRGFLEEAVLVDAGAGKTVDLERLIGERPDFVLLSAELAGQLECAEALRAVGIPVAAFSVETFEDYLRVLKICTQILETPEKYETCGEALRLEVEALISAARAREEAPRVLFVRAGSSARYTKAKTAENHFVCVMLAELGAENIADKAPILLEGLSTEEVLLSDPDAILFTTMGDEAAGIAYMESLLEDPVWSSLRAVREGNVHQLPKDLFQYKPNSRWPEAYAYLTELLYGEPA